VRLAIVAPLVAPIREPNCGGSQAFVADLARGLSGRGHDVYLYAATGSQVAGVHVVDTGVDHSALQATLYRPGARGDEGSTVAQRAFATVYAAVGRGRYDIVHNHAFDAPAIRLAGRARAAVLHTLHLPPQRDVAAALAEVCGGAPRPLIACVSEHQRAAWRSHVPVDAVLPPYIPTRAIPFADTAARGALFAGRLSPEKGAAAAIDIARAAGLSIDVFGDVYDAEYAREQIEPRRGLTGVTVHAGVARDVLWQAMARASVVLCPARWDEPFGMAAAEAQACGTPVVAFARGALAEVIADRVTGRLVAPDDVHSAAEAVGESASLSRTACRQHAERELDLELTLDAHERLYEQLAAATAPVRA
jgi:glycosyltransferase involved in cell wall biosynthesis